MYLKSYILLIIISFFSFAGNINAQDTPTLFLIGDSTCSDYSESLYPRTGWGSKMAESLEGKNIQVKNNAKSGRSSKSFYEEQGAWNTTLQNIKEDDFLIIQFAHNDEKSDDPDRYTEPYTTYQEYLSKFVTESRLKGAYPIFATPVPRNYWNSDGTIRDSHGDYVPSMIALASELEVPIIDVHELSKALFESLGKDSTTTKVFLNLQPGEYANYPEGRSDNTHLQEFGAGLIAEMVANELEFLSHEYEYLDVFGIQSNTTYPSSLHEEIFISQSNNALMISSMAPIDKVIIFDLTGRIMYSDQQVTNIKVQTSSWNQGIFAVALFKDNQSAVKKIFIK